MDRTADPCVDFDRFVCGRFNDEAIIPDKKHVTDLTTTGNLNYPSLFIKGIFNVFNL